MKYDHEAIAEYINTFQAGERVQETERSCMYKRQGTIVVREHDGVPCTCVEWDVYEGEDGQMTTSVTGGSRRLDELDLEFFSKEYHDELTQ